MEGLGCIVRLHKDRKGCLITQIQYRRLRYNISDAAGIFYFNIKMERYNRQIILPELGESGQEKLKMPRYLL